jgi:outer membrane receptor protein involved in Fe transport
VFAAVNNLFDESPPIATGTGFGGSANGGTNPVFFDALGRSLRLGVRVNF